MVHICELRTGQVMIDSLQEAKIIKSTPIIHNDKSESHKSETHASNEVTQSSNAPFLNQLSHYFLKLAVRYLRSRCHPVYIRRYHHQFVEYLHVPHT